MHEKLVDDGLFVRTHRRAETPEEMLELLRAVQPFGPGNWIERTRAEALALQEHVYNHPDPDEAAQNAVLEKLTRLLNALDNAEKGKAKDRAYWGFLAGAAWQELYIRFASNSVHAGQKCIRGAREAGADNREAAASKYSRIRAEAAKLDGQYPSMNRLYDVLEKRHGWSRSTIKRALKK